jgi:hypothetical protein
MGIFTPTTEGLAKGKLVTPATWYPVEILKCEDLQSKKDQSAYTKVTMVITAGEFKDVQLNTGFSEKWHEAVVPFVAAVTGRTDIKAFEKEIANNPVDINDRSFKGRKLEVYVERGSYKDAQGKSRDQNQITAYRPAGKAA